MKEEIKKYYIEKLPLYEKATKIYIDLIEKLISSENIQVHAIDGRTKSLDSYLKKSEKYIDPKDDIKDYIGIRVITYVKDDVNKVCELIKREFEIDDLEYTDKNQGLGINKIGYKSVHFICFLNENRKKLPEYISIKNTIVEIQVRTLLQHTWAEIEHDRNYKFGGILPSDIKRRFNLVSAVLEVADNEFNNLAKEIEKYSDDVKEEFLNNKYNVEINSTTLYEYYKSKKYKSLNLTDQKNKWNMYSNEIIEELFQFGIKNIEDLNSIDNTEYFAEIKKMNSNLTIIGMIRDLLILKNHHKYFKECWNHHWGGIEIEMYNLYEKLGVPIKNIVNKFDIDVLKDFQT